ncbi:MAG TPA: DUF5666 domain-containing protein [Verrucomicrobiae bacterium]|nr:DUF5666 domain-containing protein [Verrucomicrobiae bacterium]
MKKAVVFLSILGLLLALTPVYAGNRGEDGASVKLEAKAKADAKLKALLHDDDLSEDDFDAYFVLQGKVKAKTADSLTLNAARLNGIKGRFELEGEKQNRKDLKDRFFAEAGVVVKIHSQTKITGNNGQATTLAAINVGDMVKAMGFIDNNVLKAEVINVSTPSQKVYGEVTAKTGTSVTIKNNATGETKTVTVNPETKVSINGEVKTAADIQVGDKGIVKFKAMLDTLVAKVVQLFR